MNFKIIIFIISAITLTACHSQKSRNKTSSISYQQLALQEELIDQFSTDTNDYISHYSYVSDVNQIITLRVTSSLGPVAGKLSNLQTEITTSTGKMIESDSVKSGDTIWEDIQLNEGEALYIKLSALGKFRDEYYEYALEIYPSQTNGLFFDGDTFEPNDTKNISTNALLNTTYRSELMAGSIDQKDIYKFSLLAGKTYSLLSTIHQGPSSTTIGGIQFSLTDENDNPVFAAFDMVQNQNKADEFTPNITGTYYLKINSPLGSIYEHSYYSYSTAIWESRIDWQNPYEGDDFEPNETENLAFEMDINQTIESQLTRGADDQIDMYRLLMYPSNKYQISISATDGPNRSSLSNMRFKITSKNGAIILAPEQTIRVGENSVIELSVNNMTDAIIEIYYTPTSGHESDYHAYRLAAKLI
jgi:hypothetical protein